jgi:hypothetical protein
MVLSRLTNSAQKYLSSRLDQAGIRFVSLTVLFLSLALLAASFATSDHGKTFLGLLWEPIIRGSIRPPRS